MNNLSFSPKFMQKTQEYTTAWIPKESRNPGWSDLFIVTLRDGTVTIEKFDVLEGWESTEILAWAKLIPSYSPPKK